MQDTFPGRNTRVEELPYSSDIFSVDKHDPYKKNRRFLLVSAFAVILLSVWICAHGVLNSEENTTAESRIVDLQHADGLASPNDAPVEAMPLTRAPQAYNFSMSSEGPNRSYALNAPRYIGEQGQSYNTIR